MVNNIVFCTNMQKENVRSSISTDDCENLNIKFYIKNTPPEEIIANQGILYARGMLNLYKKRTSKNYMKIKLVIHFWSHIVMPSICIFKFKYLILDLMILIQNQKILIMTD